MDEQATGLILRTRPLTESSLIVHWLTEEAGRVATVAKGARRPKSAFKGKLDLFFRATFSFRRGRGELHNLREVSLKEMFGALRTDMLRLQQAAYAAILVERTTETDTPIPEIYQLVLELLRHLEMHPPGPLNVLAFEMKLLGVLGLAPDLASAGLSPGAKALLGQAAVRDWPLLPSLKPSAAQTGELDRFLRHFLIHHLGHDLPARQAALAGPD